MEMLSFIVMGLVGVIALGIWIYVLVKSFQEGGALHGILGLLTLGLYTFIWGWMNANRLQMRDIMLFWTFLWLLSCVIQGAMGAAASTMAATVTY